MPLLLKPRLSKLPSLTRNSPLPLSVPTFGLEQAWRGTGVIVWKGGVDLSVCNLGVSSVSLFPIIGLAFSGA